MPHSSHRRVTPSAPWPWTGLDDGVFIVRKRRVSTFILVLMKFIELDPMQLECVEPPIPPCNHSPGRCNRCWMGYPRSHFPQWTKPQIRKAKIYDAISNSPGNKHCICYRVDVNMQGFFTYAREMTHEYGNEDSIWDGLIHEQVSLSHLFLYERSIRLQRPQDTRLRALFLQDLSGPVLQMLGTKYPYSYTFLPSCTYQTMTQV